MSEDIFMAIPEIVYGEVRYGIRARPSYDFWIQHQGYGTGIHNLWEFSKARVLGESSFKNHGWKKNEKQRNEIINLWRESTSETPEMAIKDHAPKSGLISIVKWPHFRGEGYCIEVCFYINNLVPETDYERHFGFDTVVTYIDSPEMDVFLKPKNGAFYEIEKSQNAGYQPGRLLMYQKSRIEYITFTERIFNR